MAVAIGPNVHISRRRRRSTKTSENGSRPDYDNEYDEDFAVPAKRGRILKQKPLQNSAYNSISIEVNKEKQRKAPLRKPKTSKSVKRVEIEEMEDPEMNMSSRMVDRIAALNDGKRTKLGISNCFEDRTALDCIDLVLKESENMQEDAVALAIATTVYSLRVDRTHNDAQETRSAFIRGKSDAEKAMLVATGESIESAKERRKRKKAEKEAEARKAAESDVDEFQTSDAEREDCRKSQDSDSFDYTFGLEFPSRGSYLQHWAYAQELLEKVENRRLELRRKKRRKKLISYKKIPVLNFCPTYTDFVQATANLESDRIDALATFRARRDITGEVIILHDAMSRRPITQNKYSEKVDIAVVKQCRDMLANIFREEPKTWEHFLLEDNPKLYRTGQYLRTGDMTGYVLQERPFYHHFDPDQETEERPGDGFVETNADKTLYTIRKPPRGKALGRRAPLIRVPVNKYANPRNRKIEDLFFKEEIDVEPDLNVPIIEMEKVIDACRQLKQRSLAVEDMHASIPQASSSQDHETAEETCEQETEPDLNCSLLSRLRAQHAKHTSVFENLKTKFTQTARERCSIIVNECRNIEKQLSIEAHNEDEDDEGKEWKTKRFLEYIAPSKEKSFYEALQHTFSKIFQEQQPSQNEVDTQMRMVASVLGTGRNAMEWQVPEETILNDINHLIKRGIHDDIRYMDAIFHMKVFKFKVSVEQAHESLRKVERMAVGKTPAELASLKQKCFRPGRYNGITDSGEIAKSYRLDPWCLDRSTKAFAEEFFRCCNYPRLEGALLRLCKDINSASKRIPSCSFYYETTSCEEIENDRRNWEERLKDALPYFLMRTSDTDEKLFKEKRALPRLPRRSLSRSYRISSSKKTLDLKNARATKNGSTEAIVADTLETSNLDDCGDISYPEEDMCATFDEESRLLADKRIESVIDSLVESCTTPAETTLRKNKSRQELDTAEAPPKKKDKKVKSETEIKTEIVDQGYFIKSEVHTPFSLKRRFALANPSSLTRNENDIFLPRKPRPVKAVSDYKYENFVKPGLVNKGVYPGIKLELTEPCGGNKAQFSGTLKRSTTTEEPARSTDTVDVDANVYDEWLTTFGGFRPFKDDTKVETAMTSALQAQAVPPNEHDTTALDDNCHYDSFDETVYLNDGTSSKWDRFKYIRPDEFKAIGIDVKCIIPKKDFYAMTKEERAAAVAAEFDDIDAMGPKKEDGYVISIMDFCCRVVPYHLNTAKMKRVMKSILSNPLLAYDKVLYTRRALLARRRAQERHKSQMLGREVYFKRLDRTLDESLGPIAEKILEEHNPLDITAIDPIDVLEAVTYRNLEDIIDDDDISNRRRSSSSACVEESMRQFAAQVRQADFKVQGLHTFSSVMQCLPRRMGNSGKHVNIANALAVTLYMCNENSLTLVQERNDLEAKYGSVNEGEPWMGNFIITNSSDVPSLVGDVD